MSKFIVATIHPWNIEQYHEYSTLVAGDWILITKKEELTIERVTAFNPSFIFFPHWSWKVPKDIYQQFHCVCFHMTDLPFGRGGSPLQNLILCGITETKITALRMNEVLDAGPIYTKEPLSLHGSAEDIFKRATKKISKLIKLICINCPTPKPQKGKVTLFTRRTSEQSIIPNNLSPKQLYDFIRMLDAPNYPKAYSLHNNTRIEYCNAQLNNNKVTATAIFSNTHAKDKPLITNTTVVGHKHD